MNEEKGDIDEEKSVILATNGSADLDYKTKRL